ncbi:hypothetical protein [Rhodococcus pyridinivorans]|uniref:hypothetical protein n=1 Tax=Rhodococcus pyridinivorans TaxID=103816 RepID=UPI000BA242E7|nr:hypothetical protein [Rhodococcus pyridinivorans]
MSSHPDAGKSTLVDALTLHVKVIAEAEAVYGTAGRRSIASGRSETKRRGAGALHVEPSPGLRQGPHL